MPGWGTGTSAEQDAKQRGYKDMGKFKAKRAREAVRQREIRRRERLGARVPTEWDELMGFGPDEEPYDPCVTGRKASVDAGPFLEWFNWWRAVRDAEVPPDNKGYRDLGARATIEELCVAAGVAPRTLIRMKQTGRASIASIDKVLTFLDGPPFALLYPLDDELAA
jgi:hypothetical protein